MNPSISQAIDSISTWLQLIITVGAVVTLFLTVGKAAQKPNQTQDERLDALEKWQSEVETRLETGSSHFERIDSGNRVTQRALLALMSHAINGNDIDKLKKAKDDLETYLTE
jgi:hypothetical protein